MVGTWFAVDNPLMQRLRKYRGWLRDSGVILLLTLCFFPAGESRAETQTAFKIPRLSLTYCPDQGMEQKIKIPAQKKIFRDEFPLPISVRATRIRMDERDLHAVFDADTFAYTFPWNLEFFDTSFENLLRRLAIEYGIPDADLEELTTLWKTEQWDCATDRRALFRLPCSPTRRYSKLGLYPILPAAGRRFSNISTISRLSEPLDSCRTDWGRYFWIPTKIYAALLSLHVSRSYEIDVRIPEGTSAATLDAAAQYLGSLTSPKNAADLLRKGRENGSIGLQEFLPKEIRSQVNQFDLKFRDNCHSFALSTVDADFREIRRDETEDLTALAEPFVRNPKYFRILNPEEPVRFGDVIWITNRHSMVYLVGGFVLMKDNEGPQWTYRLAHLQDIGREDYLSYFPEEQECLKPGRDKDNLRGGAVAVGRRNTVPLVLDRAASEDLCPKSECYEKLKQELGLTDRRAR